MGRSKATTIVCSSWEEEGEGRWDGSISGKDIRQSSSVDVPTRCILRDTEILAQINDIGGFGAEFAKFHAIPFS